LQGRVEIENNMDKERSLVSVLMPLHNAADTLVDSVSSVRAQKYANWELVIVDDASVDGSSQLATDLAAQDERIQVFKLDHNGGAAAARNYALRMAKGRYIAFLDSDDLWDPDKLAVQLAFMKDRNAALSFTAYARMAPSHALLETVQVPSVIPYATLLKRNVMGCLTVMYDSEVLGKVDMPDLTRQHDYALWLSLARRCGGAHGLNEVLAIYRVGRGTLSAHKWGAARDIWRVYHECEGLGVVTSLWYFAHYAWYGLRYRLLQRPASGAPLLDPTFGAPYDPVARSDTRK
jgi:teichuronic acid biosynthesis glycosyltransferase TuaG